MIQLYWFEVMVYMQNHDVLSVCKFSTFNKYLEIINNENKASLLNVVSNNNESEERSYLSTT